MRHTPHIGILILTVLLLAGCATQSIEDIKNEEHVGDNVKVKGTVTKTVKLGEVSGFSLEGESGENIRVASDSLPAENTNITVTGTLMKDTVLGYYIKRE